MENQELIKQVTEKAEKWLTPAYDAETQAEVKRMLENPDKTELIECFYKDLEFGTGGLRGIMGAGSNRMNIYTVGAATQGLANYLNKCFKDKEQISGRDADCQCRVCQQWCRYGGRQRYCQRFTDSWQQQRGNVRSFWRRQYAL